MVITSHDVNHMQAFPFDRKAKIMQKIMSRVPTEEHCAGGNASYVKTIMKLHAEGLRLIDRQPLERACQSVWYGANRSLFGRIKTEVVVLVVWELDADNEDLITLRTWKI